MTKITKDIRKEIEIMDMLDNCVSEFYRLENANSRDKSEFVEFIREAQKTLALVGCRNLEVEEEPEKNCENCEGYRIVGKGSSWCNINNVYTKGDRHCNDFIRKEEE